MKMTRRKIVIAATSLAAMVALAGGGFAGGYAAAASTGTGRYADHYGSASKAAAAATTPAATPTPTTPAPTATPSPSQATLPGGLPQTTPQQIGTTQPTGQGMTMTVTGAQFSLMAGYQGHRLLVVSVTLHNANIEAGRPDYTGFVVFDPAGNRSVNVDQVPMVPAHSSLDTQLAFEVAGVSGHYDLGYGATGAQWDLPVTCETAVC